MRIQAATLYVLDEGNRIVKVNERDQTSSPAIFIGKTKDSILTYFNRDLPQFIIDDINLHKVESLNIMNLCRIIEKYKRVKDIWIGPAFTFNQRVSNSDLENEITVINESNKQLLKKHFSHLMSELEDRTPIVGYILNDDAVAVCCSARKSCIAAEASLMTIENYRGKGYAQKVVQEWGNEISRRSIIPLYSTSWDNLSSQRVAQKLGLVQFGMDFNISIE